MSSDLNLHYEGLTCPSNCAQCGHLNPVYVQGPAGPERRDARTGEGLALVRVFPWKEESSHAALHGLSRIPGQALTAKEQLALALYNHTLEALSNDGKLDAGEAAEYAEILLQHADLGGTLKSAAGLIVGLVKK